MANNTKIGIFDTILFEILERVSRFVQHLAETRDTRAISIPNYIQEYEECLNIILSSAANSVLDRAKRGKSEVSDDEIVALLDIYKALSEFHEELSHIPRQSSPVELYRFSRLLEKYLHISGASISSADSTIYLTELKTTAAYYTSPIDDFKRRSLNHLSGYSAFNNGKDKAVGNNRRMQLSIPRIESRNPCVWPTLVHEVAHHVVNEDCFEKGGILRDFRSFLTDNKLSIPSSLESTFADENVLRKWLLECWCDLFAALVMGPAFWFAQFSSFMFGASTANDKSYPPCSMRLWLIKELLQHRFDLKDLSSMSNIQKKCNDLSTYIEGKYNKHGFSPDSEDLVNFALLVAQYFTKVHFLRDQRDGVSFGSVSLNKHLGNIIKFTSALNSSSINSIVKQLELGYPVPSIRKGTENLEESETSVQEILLSAWIYRNSSFKDNIASIFERISTDMSDRKKFFDSFKSEISVLFYEFDFCILRSIQISEFVDLLSPKVADASHSKEALFAIPPEQFDASQAILTDGEILQLLLNDTIRMIPLIDPKQVGSTSVDIRLGTSFQIYHSNRSGIVDFTDPDSSAMAEKNSSFVDLDFLESIVIAPGQFILAHTMEYLGLPSTIAAEVEGRSSFARLGIEVHMTAGFVDPGFNGVLTLEIFNAGPNPIKLFPGLRIGQLRFFRCSKPLRPYNRNPHAKYKGLLTHRGSLHVNDNEVVAYQHALSRRCLNTHSTSKAI